MAMIKRYAISRTIDGVAEYYDGCGFWSDLREDAEEYRTLELAEEDAAEHGGDVFSYERFSDIADQFVTPMIVTVPALYAGHNAAGRLEQHFSQQVAAE